MWANKPEIEDDAAKYYEAFQMLSHSRPIGFGGPLPIQLFEMESYLKLYGVAAYDWVAFIKIMRVIDLGYLDLFEKSKPKPSR